MENITNFVWDNDVLRLLIFIYLFMKIFRYAFGHGDDTYQPGVIKL